MTHRNLHHLSLLILALLMTACAGVNTVRIKSEPAGAKLYVNDKYVGMTPQEVPAAFSGSGGETLKVTLMKEGYQPRKETITFADLVAQWQAGRSQQGSRYGYGGTEEFSYPLEPAGSTAPAPAPTIRRSPPHAPSAPAPSTPRPKSSQSWR